MLRIRRLNMDTSWQLVWDDTSIILDPWLVGSEVDGFSWFNEQWHTTAPVPIKDLGSYDALVVSQSYSDHCHEETLDLLPASPIYGSPKAVKRLSESMGKRLTTLPDFEGGEWQEVGPISLAYLDPGRKLDPVYYGIVIRHKDQVVLYAPHGFTPTQHQLDLLSSYHVTLLITSFSLFRLPGFMGGDVNPGMAKARTLVETLRPSKVVHTHDEEKRARGLVKKIARVVYPDYDLLKKDFPNTFVYLGEDYEYLTLSKSRSEA
ncbi:MAG: MBL fold metallo-hydrolase [Bacteroidota bacterium]